MIVLRVIAALALLGGCDLAFGLDELPTADLAPGCSGTRLLRTFGDGTLDPLWRSSLSYTSSLDASGDQLTLTTNTIERIGVASPGLDLRDDAFSIGVVTDDPQLGTPELGLYSVNTPNVIYMQERTGMLHFSTNDGVTGTTDVATLLYDPDAHRYWRISHANGETRWQTSPDDKTWTTRASQHMDWVSYVSVQLASTGNAGPYSTTFDHPNAGAAPDVVCRAIVLADDFHSATIGSKWVTSTKEGTIAPSGGQLVATVDGNMGGQAILFSTTIYDLRESSFAVHVAQMPDINTDGVVDFFVSMYPSGYFDFYQARGTLHARVAMIGDVGTAVWDPSTLSWWRLRGSKGVLYFEASPDGRHYSPLAEAHDLALDQVSLTLDLTGNQANTAVFDHFNVAP